MIRQTDYTNNECECGHTITEHYLNISHHTKCLVSGCPCTLFIDADCRMNIIEEDIDEEYPLTIDPNKLTFSGLKEEKTEINKQEVYTNGKKPRLETNRR